MMILLAVSNSEIFAAQRCWRNWYLTYYLGMVPAVEIPVGNRQLGTRVHTALEGLYGYELDPLIVLQILYKAAIEAQPEYEEELLKERTMAETMVEGYIMWLAEEGADADQRVVATENDMVVPIPGYDGVLLRSRMDQVFQRLSDGALGFMDYKTGSNFEKHETLDRNPQMKTYALMQRIKARMEPGQPLIMGGQITSLRRVLRTARSNPPYYRRDDFWYNDEQLDAHELKIIKVVQQILDKRAKLDHAREIGAPLPLFNQLQRYELPPTPIDGDCDWRCPFTAICPMMDDGSDWSASLTQSGRWVQQDPYEYYRNDAMRVIRQELSARAGNVNQHTEGEDQ
jgi:RecB family exonuclease